MYHVRVCTDHTEHRSQQHPNTPHRIITAVYLFTTMSGCPGNDVLLWPPPPTPSTEGTDVDGNHKEEAETTTGTMDLFSCIHEPGADEEEMTLAPGGLMEIHPSKVVFNSETLYPSCTRQVQKRIVEDLQRSYARTSKGRELAVKEWADENQNRGILRLRLRCKKAKCRLQFQVNWDTQQKHWFITRQCVNLAHTCPPPKTKAKERVGGTSKRRRSSATGKNGGPMNTNNGNHHHVPVSSDDDDKNECVPVGTNMPPPDVVVPNGHPHPQPSISVQSAPHLSRSPIAVVTDVDRAEAELLATDFRQWIPPPPEIPASSSNGVVPLSIVPTLPVSVQSTTATYNEAPQLPPPVLHAPTVASPVAPTVASNAVIQNNNSNEHSIAQPPMHTLSISQAQQQQTLQQQVPPNSHTMVQPSTPPQQEQEQVLSVPLLPRTAMQPTEKA